MGSAALAPLLASVPDRAPAEEAAQGAGPLLVTRLPAGQGAAPELVSLVDTHVHLDDEAMQLGLMERHGATRAVVFWGRNSDNEAIAAAALRHPERLIPFASVSPERRALRRAWEEQDPALLTTLDRLLASGRFRGIGEISAAHFPSPGLPEADCDPTSPIMRGILDLARKYRVPVMVDIEIPRMKELSPLLDAYRDVPVIWAHGGHTPLFLARRMLKRHPNLYCELSARTWRWHARAPDYIILRDGRAIWPEWLERMKRDRSASSSAPMPATARSRARR